MVKRVANSFINEIKYRETNISLAKENADLKFKLACVNNQVADYQDTLLKKELEISQLNHRLKQLEAVNKKYELVKQFMVDDNLSESLLDQADKRKESPLAIDGQPAQQNDNTTTTATSKNQTVDCTNNSISDSFESFHEENEGRDDSGMQRTRRQSELVSQLIPIAEISEDEQMDVDEFVDSLDPLTCTTLPSLRPEVVVHTPSIWKCLDNQLTSENECESTLKDDNQASPIRPTFPRSVLNDMFQSTPVQNERNKKAKLDNNKPDSGRYNLRKRKHK